MKILKFGGTSMGTFESLTHVVNIIAESKDEKMVPVVVCSAMSQVTNKLHAIEVFLAENNIEAARDLFEIIRTNHERVADGFGVKDLFVFESDQIFEVLERLILQGHELSDIQKASLIACGERLSVRLLSSILVSKQIDSKSVDSTFIRTRGQSWFEDEIDWDITKLLTLKTLNPLLENKIIPVVTGYFGMTEAGDYSSMGRGSSDFTGAILTVCLGRKQLEIWTDVDGFMTADPRIVKKAEVLKELNYQEVTELCFFGAKVLHPKTIRPVVDNTGEVWIKNTFNGSAHGTRILKKSMAYDREILSIASKKTAVVSLDLFDTQVTAHRTRVMADLFCLFDEYGYSIDVVTSREGEITICFDRKYLDNTDFRLGLESLAPVAYKNDSSVLSLVFSEMAKDNAGVINRITRVLAEQEISLNVISQTASEVCLLLVVLDCDVTSAIGEIHKELVE